MEDPERVKKRPRREKVRKVMAEFEAGTLRSSSGQPVRSKAQAVAIALSEQRRAQKKRRR